MFRPADAPATRAMAPQFAAARLRGDVQRVHVADGDTFTLGETRIRLFGIDAPELAQQCRDAGGQLWACGRWSKQVLEKLVQGGVDCVTQDTDRYGRTVAQCEGATGDLGAAMVAAGAAFAYEDYSQIYLPAEDKARRAGIGLWQSTVQAPEDYRAAKRQVRTPQEAPEGCLIKGNISGSGRIYHVPGGRWYDKTRVSLDDGERWFCSEVEARNAGWRKSRQ